MPDDRLIGLYADMAALTRPECGACRVPWSCCDPLYCRMAVEYARDVWGEDITVLKTAHPTLPFMGESGCVVAPHLRPPCTLHTRAVNALGAKPGDEAWNEKYRRLRDEIDRLEFHDE